MRPSGKLSRENGFGQGAGGKQGPGALERRGMAVVAGTNHLKRCRSRTCTADGCITATAWSRLTVAIPMTVSVTALF